MSYRSSGLVAVAVLFGVWLAHGGIGRVATVDPATNYLLSSFVFVLGILVARRLPSAPPLGKTSFQNELPWLAASLGVFHVVCLMLAGLALREAGGLYEFDIVGVFLGALFVMTSLVLTETCRYRLVRGAVHSIRSAWLFPVAVLVSCAELSVQGVLGVRGVHDAVTFVGGDFVPSVAEGFLCCVLSYLGGPLPAVLYRGIVAVFEWFSPVQPALTWGFKAVIGLLVPALGFMAIEAFAYGRVRWRRGERRPRYATSIVQGIGVVAAVVLAFWFFLGSMPWYPVAVAGGSMSPTFEYGDMVIVERISGEQMMDEGDVVVYRQNGSRIVHRVVRVAGQNPPLYVTKGDANDAPDSVQLRQNEIEGRVLTSVPLAGWPTLILKKG